MLQKKQLIIIPIINGKEVSQKKYLVTKGVLKQAWETPEVTLIRYLIVLILGIWIGAGL